MFSLKISCFIDFTIGIVRELLKRKYRGRDDKYERKCTCYKKFK